MLGKLKLVGLVVVMSMQMNSAVADDRTAVKPALVPQPALLETLSGAFTVTDQTSVFVNSAAPEVQQVGAFLAERLGAGTGLKLKVKETDGSAVPDGAILLTTIGASAQLGDEGYALDVSPQRVLLQARTAAGLLHGVQTIRQLLPAAVETPGGLVSDLSAAKIPCVRIIDRPRYRWRGMMLDCCRHFMTKDFVKRYIDLLAYHKMNVLHWHLTEDQGWRIEIKKYPKLAEISAWRQGEEGRYGGFYTHDDIREIVAYAASRHITVVPEIEMPGHSQAALAAYPELSCTGGPFEVGTRWGIYPDVYCAGNDQVFEFLQNVLLEVFELFPSEYVHVGGDECPKVRWKECPKCQARIKAEGLMDENELQSYFIRRMERFLSQHGRRLVGWDEILEGGLAPNATVQSWRGMDGAIAAATAGHDVISSPTSHCYLDYSHDRIDLRRIYSFEPTPPELSPEQAKHVLGGEGNVWTERIPQERVDRQVFPRLAALAEVTWSPAEARDWPSFTDRMKAHYAWLDALGVTYYVSPPVCASADRVFTDSTRMVLENPIGRGEIHFTTDGSDPTADSTRYSQPMTLTESATVRARVFLPNGRQSDVVEYQFRKLTPLAPVRIDDPVSGLAYEYYESYWSSLPDFATLEPVASGTATTIDLAVRKRDGGYALRFTGYLEVPRDGTYTFHLTSDDGSRLYIADELVIEHDGLHSASEQSGQIILKAGHHPITVTYFQAGGANALKIEYAGPQIERQPIPASALSCAGEQRQRRP